MQRKILIPKILTTRKATCVGTWQKFKGRENNHLGGPGPWRDEALCVL